MGSLKSDDEYLRPLNAILSPGARRGEASLRTWKSSLPSCRAPAVAARGKPQIPQPIQERA